MPTIDRARSAERIERDIETLAGPEYTRSEEAIRRYAYTPEYRATLDYFVRELEAIGFEISYDPVGTLVARNRPPGEKVFGVGSHCDSNRNGGKYDGTMGVVTALEVCRLNAELGLDLPLQLISFLEEEGSGFGQMLLGSRIIAQRVTEEELREQFRAIDDGRSFWEHAEDGGLRARSLEGVASDPGRPQRLGRAAHRAGSGAPGHGQPYRHRHGDRRLHPRRRAPRGPRRPRRRDAHGLPARRRARRRRGSSSRSSGSAQEAGDGTVGTVGEIEFQPGLINVVPGRARLSLDTRGVVEEGFHSVAQGIESFAQEAAAENGLTATYRQRQTLPVTHMDDRLVAALEEAARSTGEPFMLMPSGAAHDTMCVADHVPTRDGLRPLSRRHQPRSRRGGRPGRRGPGRRDHPDRDRLASRRRLEAHLAQIGSSWRSGMCHCGWSGRGVGRSSCEAVLYRVYVRQRVV